MDLAAVGNLLVFVGVLATALMAGLFFGWSVSAVPGLREVPDQTYVTTMQAINRAILNPLFLVTFMAALPLLVSASAVSFAADAPARGWWLAAASATYGVGVLGVTVGGNVPLNEALARFDRAAATEEEVAHQRRDYESRWNRWQTVRAYAVVLALALATAGALSGGTGG